MPLLHRALPLLVVLLAAALSACSPSARLADAPEPTLGVPPVERVRLEPRAGTSEAGAEAEVESLPSYGATVAGRIWAHSQDWLGVPYRYGGEDRGGIDCSAFVQTILGTAFGVRLSRATATQVKEGEPVARDDLRAGDLVFFRTGRRTRHVGIYLGDGSFVHASTRDGVTVSGLDDGYYKRTYWTARRVLDPEAVHEVLQNPPLADAELPSARPQPPRQHPPRAQRPAAEPNGQRRSGW